MPQEHRAMIQFNRSQETAADIQDPVAELMESALALVRQGFAPPAEIYRVEYRNRVD
jgi:hypothetical protein